jgi:hypothetical protein
MIWKVGTRRLEVEVVVGVETLTLTSVMAYTNVSILANLPFSCRALQNPAKKSQRIFFKGLASRSVRHSSDEAFWYSRQSRHADVYWAQEKTSE